MSSPEESARQRLEFLDAFAAAIERREEVFDAIADSEYSEGAQARLVSLLGISAEAAIGVLDLQARRFTRQGYQHIADERAELRRFLGR